MASVVRDKRGSIVAQFALLLPGLIIVALMAFEVWQIIWVKKSLHMSAYQAVRYISTFPLELQQQQDLSVMQTAETLIRDNLASNPLLADRIDDVQIYVSPLGWHCGDEFDVAVAIDWQVTMPLLERVWRGNLVSTYHDYIRCRE
jgi:hypothetical protein